MATLTHRAYAGDADLAAALALWLAARATGGGDPWPSLDVVQAELAARPGGTAYAELWEDRRGLAGMALLLDESVLAWCARPGAGDEALEAEVVAWALGAVVEAAGPCGERPTLFVPALSDDARLAALLKRAGFVEDGWRTLRMARSLRAPLAEPRAPAGLVIRPVGGAEEQAAVAALHGGLFAGGQKVPGERAALMRAPGYRPGLDLMAARSDGGPAGYAIGLCCALEGRYPARASGWVEYVGVERGQRRRGVGAALTLALLHAMRVEGLDTALLTTGAANLAARALFERCGFVTRHEIRWYVREAGLGAGREVGRPL